jgi:ribonuclease HI
VGIRKVPSGRGGRREQIFVDASFHEGGVGGIGIWIPRRGIALALKVDAKTSMEAEILALLAGAMAAKRLDIQRPLIFSDCKSAVRTATLHMNIARTDGLRRKLAEMFRLSREHKAFRHVLDQLHALGGSMAWQPREQNREADLASNIGSRVGNMGISLSGAKNRNHALNDVLSLASNEDWSDETVIRGLVYRNYRGGTKTVCLAKRRVANGRTFHRSAPGLIARLSAEVA